MISVDEALKESLTPPDHYYGAITDLVRQGWAQVAGIHRDSDVLSMSNWETMLSHYREKYSDEDFRIEGSSHWLVGWSDCLLVRALDCGCEDSEIADFSYTTVPLDNETTGKAWYCWTCEQEATIQPIFEDAMEFAERLENYPVLDEEDFSERENNELMEYLEQEVGEADVQDLAEYLFDQHSVCNVDDVSQAMIDAWKEQRKLNWTVTVYMNERREVAITYPLKEMTEADASDKAWKDITSDYPDYYDWTLEEIDGE